MTKPNDPDVSAEELRSFFAYNPETGVVTNRVTRGPRALAGVPVSRTINNGWGHTYYQTCFFRKRILIHRLIWKLQTGGWPAGIVDHVNGNGLDNRWCNLRDVTLSTNAANLTKLPDRNTSGVQGVDFHKLSGRWRARLTHQRRGVLLSYHDTKREAVVARRLAEQQYFPEVSFRHSIGG